MALALLFTVGERLPAAHVHPQVSKDLAANALVGKKAPPELLGALTKLPAIAVIYPGCAECSVETPHLLKGQEFRSEVTVLIPGASDEEIAKLGDLGPRVTCRSAPTSLAETLAIPAAPRIVKVSRDGTLVYLQPTYVPGRRLHEIINAE